MAAIITNNLRIHNAEQFLESFSETSNTNYYVFIGKSLPWNDNLDSANTIPEFIDNQNLIFNLYDEMIAVKKVIPTDVDLVIPRYDWVSGTVYNKYDNLSNTLFNSAITSKIRSAGGSVQKEQQPFYCLADLTNFSIYKCIANSKGAPSVVKPTGTSTEVFTTGDGYKWKYMYTIPVGKRSKFLNTDFMYISDFDYSANTDGALDFIEVTNIGSQYTSTPSVNITGDGINATATVTLSGDSVSNVNIVTRGLNYRYANISITGGGGSNATARAIINPKGGHAANAKLELGGFYIMLSPQIANDESGTFPIDNDFRTIGIIKDPYLYGTKTIATSSQYSLRKNLYVSNISGTFTLDEYINGSISSANAVISSISLDAANSKANIKYFQANNITVNSNNFFVSEVIIGSSSGALGTLLEITNQGIEHDSGQILYVDAFRPIQRSEGQIETLQLVIEF
jgi:hypothetical protein